MALPAYSQVILVDRAYELSQKKDFQKAREAIDLASGNEITAQDARTWYLKGFIYKELFKNTAETREDLRQAALTYFQKSIQLDTKGLYRKDCQTAIRYLHVTYYNQAITEFNRHAYEKAMDGFAKYLQYRANEPADESYAEASYYAGYTSGLLGKRQDAQHFYEQALRLNYNSPLLYNDLTGLYESLGKDSLAVRTVTAGRQRFPGDISLRIAEINLLLSLGNFAQVEKLVEEYLAADPRNVEVLLVAGTVYEKSSQNDSLNRESYFNKRKDVYQRVLALEPDNFSANYNMGITLYNRGVDLIKAQRYDLDIVVLYEILEKVSTLFQQARPYVEKAYSLSPNNLNALKALEGIYYNLNEKEKSRQMRTRLNEMK
jgi:tetratricopeptide (TPR) repeat protein